MLASFWIMRKTGLILLLVAAALDAIFSLSAQAQGLVGAPVDPRFTTLVDYSRICDSFYVYANCVTKNLHIYVMTFAVVLFILVSCYLQRVHRILELLALCVEFVAIGYFCHLYTYSQDFNLFQLVYSAAFQPLFGSISGIYGQCTCVGSWFGPEYYSGLSSLKNAIIATSYFLLFVAVLVCLMRLKVSGLKQSCPEVVAILLFPASFHIGSLLVYSYFCSIAVIRPL